MRNIVECVWFVQQNKMLLRELELRALNESNINCIICILESEALLNCEILRRAFRVFQNDPLEESKKDWSDVAMILITFLSVACCFEQSKIHAWI
ncbi:Post-transcriptional regulator [Dirofilaria immitis]